MYKTESYRSSDELILFENALGDTTVLSYLKQVWISTTMNHSSPLNHSTKCHSWNLFQNMKIRFVFMFTRICIITNTVVITFVIIKLLDSYQQNGLQNCIWKRWYCTIQCYTRCYTPHQCLKLTFITPTHLNF